MLNHLRMPAQICDRVACIQFPMIRVFPQNVISPPDFARPVFVFPRPADGWHILEPGQFLVKMIQFIQVSKLPRPAGAVEQKQLVGAIESAFFPVFMQRPHIADERGHTGHG